MKILALGNNDVGMYLFRADLLLEIAEARYKKASTIFCSQFDVPGWREKIGDPILADAVCDRIVHDSYSIVIDCKESMRKRKGISE